MNTPTSTQNTHKNTHTDTHTYTHTQTHTSAHTHAHTNTEICMRVLSVWWNHMCVMSTVQALQYSGTCVCGWVCKRGCVSVRLRECPCVFCVHQFSVAVVWYLWSGCVGVRGCGYVFTCVWYQSIRSSRSLAKIQNSDLWPFYSVKFGSELTFEMSTCKCHSICPVRV